MKLLFRKPLVRTELEEFEPSVEAYCRLSNIREETSVHSHEYYEVFLVTEGSATHYVNKSTFSIKKGNLVFVRKNDLHGFIDTSPNFRHINFSFSENSLDSFVSFIGNGFNMNELIESKYSPMILLTKQDTNNLNFRMSELFVANHATYNMQELKSKARYLIAYIFINYFSNTVSTHSEIPFWLEHTHDAMKLPKNFIAGHDRMVEISGRSPEHLSRNFKKYYNVTPINYILELRLNHAAALLSSSTLSVTEICYECGFNSLAWFYEVFTKQFGITPKKYRKKYL